jgi:hypothetical protein
MLVYVYVYVYVYVCVYVYMHVHAYVYADVSVFTNMLIYEELYIGVKISENLCKHAYACMCVPM